MSTNSVPYNPVVFRSVVLVVVIVPLAGTALSIVLLWERAVHWSDLVLLAVFYVVTMVGITVGYHRMLAHRSFRAQPATKLLLLILGSMALQSNPIEWTATHIKHHALADREGDPHSPLDGFIHANVGWMVGIGLNDADPEVYCRRLLKDPIVIFVVRTYWLWVALGFVIPFLLGGWSGLLWGGLVRMALQHHVTWSVNSVCHMFGKREFATRDESHNEWIVGLLAFGEGWHNNHHAFPRSAFHGLHWWQFDLSGYLIWTLERLSLVDDVYYLSPAAIERRSSQIESVTGGMNHDRADSANQ